MRFLPLPPRASCQRLVPPGRAHGRPCRARLGSLALLAVGMTLGCAGDTTGPAPTDPARLYWSLTLNHEAVTLSTVAPYDTVQLVATPRTTTGVPLPAPRAVQYTIPSGDTSIAVSPTGLVTAHAATIGQPVKVVVTATVGQVTLRASVFVRVTNTATPPAFAALGFQIDDGSGDITIPHAGPVLRVSCQSPYSGFGILGVARAADGTPIPEAVISYQTSAPAVLDVANPFHGGSGGSVHCTSVLAHPGRPDTVTITATATVYGVTRTASLRVVVTLPLAASVNVWYRTPAATGVLQRYFTPDTVTIGVGGVVYWVNTNDGTDRPIDVVFDHPPGPVLGVDPATLKLQFQIGYPIPYDTAGGNIAPFNVDTVQVSLFDGAYVFDAPTRYRARRFTVAGTYPFHSTLYPTHGAVIVRDTLP